MYNILEHSQSEYIAFSISKSYFIHFNNSLYNTPNIKGYIILPHHLNIVFYSLFILYSLKSIITSIVILSSQQAWEQS